MKTLLILITSLLFLTSCNNELINVPKRCYTCEFMIWSNHISKDGSQNVSIMKRSSRQYFRVDGGIELKEFMKRYTESYISGDSIKGEKNVVCHKMDSVIYWDK